MTLIQEVVSSFTPQTAASAVTRILWLIPALPIVASGCIALMKQPRRQAAATLSIGSLGISLLISIAAFAHVLSGWLAGNAVREIFEFYLDPLRIVRG